MEGNVIFIRAVFNGTDRSRPVLNLDLADMYIFRGQDVQIVSTLPKILQQPLNGAPGSPVETFSRCSSTIIINDYASKTPP